MINYQLKGMFNQHSLFKLNDDNIANNDNRNNFAQIILGNQESESLKYLLNVNHQRLSDFKSMLAYNETNYAALVNEHQILNEINDEDTRSLPKSDKKIKESFYNVLNHRKSTRKFTSFEMACKELSTILKFSFGIAPRKVEYVDIKTSTRFYASAGGLYPIDIYLYINNVEDYDKGIYLYQPISHSLLKIVAQKDINTDDILEGDNIDIENCNFLVFFGYNFNSSFLKYGELALLNSLIEIGCMSHDFDLVITSLGYTGCPIAGFKKNNIEKLLELDHVNEHILFTNICGKE
ncbi:TPA: SagB family peptide dehydrogenase [Staphylococcus aureus]|nr:SagB family peptide dehydrogenase [Staphylococcus aureus]